MNEYPIIEKAEPAIGHVFNNKKLLIAALTHPSYAAEQKLKVEDNQRLEFLGDAVIELIVTTRLFSLYPDKQEGELSKMRSAVTNQKCLADIARAMQMTESVILGKGEKRAGGADRPSTMCDVMEAVTAAIYLDAGYSAAEKFFWDAAKKCGVNLEKAVSSFNPKGALQEYTQNKFHKLPQYRVDSIEGPEHCPVYNVSVIFGEEVLCAESANSRKEAESKADVNALTIIEERSEEQ